MLSDRELIEDLIADVERFKDLYWKYRKYFK